MNSIDELKKLYGVMNEDSLVVHCKSVMTSVPPFMCTPMGSRWFWASEVKELVRIVFEEAIASYLISEVEFWNDGFELDEWNFKGAIGLYREYMSENELKMECIDKLESLYEKNINKDISYKEFVKLLIDIESGFKMAEMYMKFTSFTSPLEARHLIFGSSEFDFDNLEVNFWDSEGYMSLEG